MMHADPLHSVLSPPHATGPQIVKPKSLATVVPESVVLPKIVKSNDGQFSSNALQLCSPTGTDAAGSETSEKPAKIRGIIFTPGTAKKRPRADRRGNAIDRGRKGHRITFRDEIRGEQIAEVIEVDSYKQFNLLAEEANTVGCTCAIL